MDNSLVIALVSVAWSAGLFCGMLTTKFVTKKSCDDKHKEVWGNIDAMRNCMAGGVVHFELRRVEGPK
jgi:hypothetical protein